VRTRLRKPPHVPSVSPPPRVPALSARPGAARRNTAKDQLAESVAALASIRLDLLRLHAGASDLTPLTTLLDAARDIGEDLHRLAEAQREVEDRSGTGHLT
jgi:hypothetical protein